MPRVTVEVAGQSASIDYTVTSPASDADNLFAIRVFPTYSGKTYGNHAAVLDLLSDLGVRRISHLMTPSMSADVVAFTQTAAARGALSWLTVGQPLKVYSSAQWTKMRQLLTGPLRGIVTKVCGFNEPNNEGDTDWLKKTTSHAELLRAMIDLVNADYETDGTPPIRVACSPLWNGSQTKHDADLADLGPAVRPFVDEACWHLYFRGGPPDNNLDHQHEVFAAAFPGKPAWSHESGAFTAPNYTGGSNPSTEAQQAVLVAGAVREYAGRGLGLSWFELLDDPDPSGTLREASLGLVRCPTLDPASWSLKPSFTALRDELARQYQSTT